ncbi:MAG: hypothetical protein DDT36_00490 [Firmicutes bacterium]|nr:hypothetical protein [Bacillota bacterium]
MPKEGARSIGEEQVVTIKLALGAETGVPFFGHDLGSEHFHIGGEQGV